MQITRLLTVLLLLFFSFTLTAQSFEKVDSTFGAFITQLYMQPDGKFLAFVFKSKRAVMRPDYHYMWMRFHANGTLDEQFGTNGSVALNHQNPITHGVLQTDGKVVLTGYLANENEQSVVFLERYNADGSLDTSFGEQGRFQTQEWQYETKPTAIALTKEQDILVCTRIWDGIWNSTPTLTLSRVQTNGQLDMSFGEAGTVTFLEPNIWDGKLTVQADDKLLLLINFSPFFDQDFSLTRLLPNGHLDATFGEEGKTIINTYEAGVMSGNANDFATDFMLLKDESILVTGSVDSDNNREPVIFKFSSNGHLATNFGSNGRLTLQFEGANGSISRISKQFDNQVLLQATSDKTYGRNNRLFLQRYLMDFNVGIFKPVLSAKELLIYPNPIQQAATLKYSLANPENITIQLVDVQGKILTTYIDNQAQSVGSYQQPIELPTYLPTGVYILTIRSATGQVAIKVRK